MLTKQIASQTHTDIIRYFESAGMDYSSWSPRFDMHFGFYRKGLNPFNRAALLDQLNEEVRNRLKIRPEHQMIYDLGCGLGATARYLAERHPELRINGLTITPWQVSQGNQLSLEHEMEDQVRLVEGDFCDMPFDRDSADACYAIESACYAPGADKAALIAEMARVLKPGGRFVIADGFRKHSRPLPAWLESVYRRNLNCWALTDLGEIQQTVQCLRHHGFCRIRVEDISWRVAPSFMHIPAVTVQFLWKHWRQHGHLRLAPERWNNIKAPLLGMLMGLARPHFGYYMISGQRKKS